VPITLYGWDNIGITKYAVEVDGISLPASSSDPSVFPWDTWKYSVGSHVVTTHASDAEGNTSTQQYTFNVVRDQDLTKPTVKITSPVASAVVKGNITVKTEAKDNIGVVQVKFAVDGTLVQTITTAPFEINLDTTKLSNGVHTIKVGAYDAKLLSSTYEISIVVDNEGKVIPQPTPVEDPDPITPKEPQQSPTPIAIKDVKAPKIKVVAAKGEKPLTIIVSDDRKVARVELLLGGKKLATTTSLPFKKRFSIKAAAVKNKLTVRAYDESGNMQSETKKLLSVVGKLSAKNSFLIIVKHK
jgi:hypothetical protein